MKKIIIGLMGHSFHCTNLGVGALAVSECAILKKIAEKNNIDLKIVCFESGVGAQDFRNATDVQIELDYYTYSPKMINKFKQCDMIIDATGGDSFADIYGAKIFLVGLVFKFCALIVCKQVVLAPQTIGPFHNRCYHFMANLYMRFVKHICIRDEMSMVALDYNNADRVLKAADMAFRLPYKKSELGQGKVGFNVSGLLYDKNNTLLNNAKIDYQKLCDNIIELLLRYNKKVVLVSHVIGDKTTITDNDYCASFILKEKYPQLEIAPVFENPVEAKSYISGLDFFIGSRMHAVIAAVSSRVPAVPIAYSRKFKGVFEPLNYDVTLDALTLSGEEILEQIEYWLIHENELREKVALVQGNAECRLAAYEEHLEKMILEIVNR